MSQLDQATQGNAASSEELAATAAEMRGQAQQLQELIADFTLAQAADGENDEASEVESSEVRVEAPEGPDAVSEANFQRFEEQNVA